MSISPDIEIFERYGMTLRRLAEADIEMLRNWRNAPGISCRMTTQQYITPAAQKAWFDSIKDRDDAYYFITCHKGIPGGYACIKNIDWDKRCGEPGGFSYITDGEGCASLPYVFYGALAMYDLFFEELQLNSTYIHVLSDNRSALRFNRSLGYVHVPDKDKDGVKYFTLTKADYFIARDALLKTLSLIGTNEV